MSAHMDNQWSRMRAIVRSEIGESAFDRWIKILTLESWNGKTVTILAPTAAISSWVRQNYRQRLQQLWRDLNPDVAEIVVASPSELDTEAEDEEEEVGNPSLARTPPFSDRPNQIWRFDSFILDESNRVACSVAQALPETLSLDHSPLYIHGGVGLGKTHILHALANHLEQAHRPMRYLLLTAEKFAQGFVQALKQQSIEVFKTRCRSVDFLLLDDVHFLSGRDKMQEELMHTLDALQQANKRIVLTADCAPGDLETIQPRVRSLLSGGVVCRIEPPSTLLRRAVVDAKVKAQAARIPDEILEFVVANITESVRVLEGAINRVIIHSKWREGTMTLDLARDLLKDLFQRTHRRVTIDEIQQKVAEHYSLKSSELNSVRRSQDIARPRQIAMYLAKQLTNRSMPEIGRKFGGRDHTTVMHAVKRVQGLRKSDEEVGRDVQTLQRMLEN